MIARYLRHKYTLPESIQDLRSVGYKNDFFCHAEFPSVRIHKWVKMIIQTFAIILERKGVEFQQGRQKLGGKWEIWPHKMSEKIHLSNLA